MLSASINLAKKIQEKTGESKEKLQSLFGSFENKKTRLNVWLSLFDFVFRRRQN